ncbi:hypothetical protein D3C76_1075440 [compost metagenome]
MVDVHAGIDQQLHGLHMPAFGGRDQGGTAIAVGALEVGAMGKGQAQDIVQSPRTGIQVGAVVDVVLGVHIGTGLDQYPCRFDLVAMGRQQQRRAAKLVAGFAVGALFKQAAYARGVAIVGGVTQLAFQHAAFGAGGDRGHHGQ